MGNQDSPGRSAGIPNDPEMVLAGYGWCGEGFRGTKLCARYIRRCRDNIRAYLEERLAGDAPVRALLEQTTKHISQKAAPLDEKYLMTWLWYDINEKVHNGFRDIATPDIASAKAMRAMRPTLPEAARKCCIGGRTHEAVKLADDSKEENWDRKYSWFRLPSEALSFELDEACLCYLKYRCAHDPTIIKENFMRMAALEDAADIACVLVDAYNALCTDLERVVAYGCTDEMLLERCRKTSEDAQKTFEEADRMRSEASKAEEEWKGRYSDLKHRYNELKRWQAESGLEDELHMQQRLIDKYLRQLEEKDGEIAALKKKEDAPEDDGISTEEDPLPGIDRDGRYVFFLTDTDFERRIGRLTELFPNSTFTGDADRIYASTTDAVFMMTRHVRHDAYYACKNACKKKGVPLIHVSHRNPDMVMKVLDDAARAGQERKE